MYISKNLLSTHLSINRQEGEKDGMVNTESIRGYGLGYQIERIERVIFKDK
jgi:hypothetical protein